MYKAVLCVPCLELVHQSREEACFHKDVCGLAVALDSSGRNFLVTHIQKYGDG